MHPVMLYKIGRDNVFVGIVLLIAGVIIPLMFIYEYNIWNWKSVVFFGGIFLTFFLAGIQKIIEGKSQMREAWKSVDEQEAKEEAQRTALREGSAFWAEYGYSKKSESIKKE